MVALDTNIIGKGQTNALRPLTGGIANCHSGTAIPNITTQFNSLNDIGWYGSVFLMTQLAFQTTYGRLYTLFNTKRV